MKKNQRDSQGRALKYCQTPFCYRVLRRLRKQMRAARWVLAIEGFKSKIDNSANGELPHSPSAI